MTVDGSTAMSDPIDKPELIAAAETHCLAESAEGYVCTEEPNHDGWHQGRRWAHRLRYLAASGSLTRKRAMSPRPHCASLLAFSLDMSYCRGCTAMPAHRHGGFLLPSAGR